MSDGRLRVFLSYTGTDKFAAQALRDLLVANEIDVWLDTERIAAGSAWRNPIEEAIRRSDIVAVLIGKQSSFWAQSEVETSLREYAQSGRPQVAPILLPGGGIKSVPFSLRAFPALDLTRQGVSTKSLRRILTRFASNLEGGPPDYELVADRLRNTGDPRAASDFYQKALEDQALDKHPESREATLHRKFGTTLVELEESDRARREFERALAIHERLHGPNHSEVALDLSNLGSLLYEAGNLEGARTNFERALEIQRSLLAPSDPVLSTGMTNLGNILRQQGDLRSAQELFANALAIDEAAYGPDAPQVARDLANLGGLAQDAGDLNTARSLFERALVIGEATFGPDHPEVSHSLNNLGGVLYDMGDLATAQILIERALSIDEAAYGPDHPAIATRLGNLGNIRLNRGDHLIALGYFERALWIDENAFGQEDPRVLTDVANLAVVAESLGDVKRAIQLYERSIAGFGKLMGPNDPTVLAASSNLAYAYELVGRINEAIALFETTLTKSERVLGPHHPNTLILRNNLAGAYQSAGRLDQAIDLLERALAHSERALGPDHPDTQNTRERLADLVRAGRPAVNFERIYETTVSAEEVAQALADYFRAQEFEAQVYRTSENRTVMQARKESLWRQLLGVTYALTVVITPEERQLSISLGGHEWVDAAVSGAIGLVAVPPVLLGTAYGIWKENRLDPEVWQVIDKAVGASEPERTTGAESHKDAMS